MVGRVEALGAVEEGAEGEPLLFHRGLFGRFSR
ncbi:Flavin reductase family protein OS=Streptomyces microflavus OX=1919 GN=G3I39_05440 PE=3 SV=1 [Streptomyces microflavus]